MLKFLIFIFSLVGHGVVYADDSMQFRFAPNTAENNFIRKTFNGGQHEIFAYGKIDFGATERFQKFVTANRIDDAIVLFNSGGGSLFEGVKLGKAIRAMGFNTGIGSHDGQTGQRRLYQGVCASSCAYAFAGGEYRFYNGGKENLGIHQFYKVGNNQADISSIQMISSMLVDYLQSMGVDPMAFVAASETPSDSMLWLTSDQAITLGLSNNGSKQTTAEIKMSGTDPYLKLEQVTSNVISRVLFDCENNRISLLAGIVTTPETSKDKESGIARSYLETDSGELLVLQGRMGASAVDSVLWLKRAPINADLQRILKSTQLGIWTENGGPMRWGATMDLRPAREKIASFIKNCTQGP